MIVIDDKSMRKPANRANAALQLHESVIRPSTKAVAPKMLLATPTRDFPILSELCKPSPSRADMVIVLLRPHLGAIFSIPLPTRCWFSFHRTNIVCGTNPSGPSTCSWNLTHSGDGDGTASLNVGSMCIAISTIAGRIVAP